MILHLRVVEASDIPQTDISRSDMYCSIQIYPYSTSQYVTEIKSNSNTPYWNQTFKIPIGDISTSLLCFTVFNNNAAASTLTLPLSTMPFGYVIDNWYMMGSSQGNNPGGMIHLVTHLTTPDLQPFLQMPTNTIPNSAYQNVQNPQYPNYPTPPYTQPPYPPQSAQQPSYPPQQYPYQQPYQQQPVYQPQQPSSMPPGYQQPNHNYQTHHQHSPYSEPNNIPPPPRPPGISDEHYRKLMKAQKKVLKKVLKGNIRGGIRKGMKCILKV